MVSLGKDLYQPTTDAPLVSVLVPARNEEQRVLEPCIRSILTQDYGNFEVIAVNDRSTDQTGAILETFARSDSRLRVIEGEALPAGWLGKPYAMQQALHHARGEWILATDADMIFAPAALRTALDRVLENGGDALTLIPRFETGSFWERVMIPTWECGYEALKDEVMEDVRLAERIKRSGARLMIDRAPELISTRMYRTFGEMWECSTKNWFSGVNFSFPFALLCVVSMYLVAVAPALIALISLIAIASGADLGSLFVPAAFAWLLQVFVMAIVSRRSAVSPVYALTAPLGLALLYAMLFDSGLRITTGRGVTWKGRRIYDRGGVAPPRLQTATSPISNVEDRA